VRLVEHEEVPASFHDVQSGVWKARQQQARVAQGHREACCALVGFMRV
jgi:hypothetical protein